MLTLHLNLHQMIVADGGHLELGLAHCLLQPGRTETVGQSDAARNILLLPCGASHASQFGVVGCQIKVDQRSIVDCFCERPLSTQSASVASCHQGKNEQKSEKVTTK